MKIDQTIPTLGVPEMDRDHQEIEALFAAVAETGDGDLPALLDRLADEIAEHFAREERLMAEGHVPLIECHRAQHRMILREVAEIARVADIAEPQDLRRLIAVMLRQTVAAHVASVDRVAAAYLLGTAEDLDFDAMRLPPRATKM